MQKAKCKRQNEQRRLRTRSHSSFRLSPFAFQIPRRRGLGLIELLTLVAILMVAFALMVGTARHVRAASSNELTRKRMLALADAAAATIAKGVDPTIPVPMAGAAGDDEDRLQRFALRSSLRLDAAINARPEIKGEPAAPTLAPALATAIVAAAAGRPELDDAWGRPIALMPRQEPQLGMAPDDGPFLVSAGPDGRFLTLSDNIYSYDLPVLIPGVRGQGSGFREAGGSGASKDDARLTPSDGFSAPDP